MIIHRLPDVNECNHLVCIQSHRTIRWFEVEEEERLNFNSKLNTLKFYSLSFGGAQSSPKISIIALLKR
jgi:hypothetical protein